MVLDGISQFFRNLFGFTGGTSITSNGIVVWMPRFIRAINLNTERLLDVADSLNAATNRIEARRKAQEKAKELINSGVDSGRRVFNSFLERLNFI